MNFKSELRQLFDIMNETDKMYNVLAKKVDLSFNQLIILYYLRTHKNVTQKDIASDMLVPKQTINSILNNWIKDGFIIFQNESSKKNKIILLSEEGEEVLGVKIDYIMDRENLILSKFSQSEVEALVSSNLEYLKIMKEVIKEEE